MEQIKPESGYKFCFLSGIIAGILMGMAALMVVVGYRLDYYYETTAFLEKTIADKNERLEKLEQTINTRNLILEDIEILLTFQGDDTDKIVIEEAIHEKYTSLIGKEVKSIDAVLTAAVIDNRIFKIADREYKIHVDKLIITDVLKMWVDIETME